MKRTFWLFVSLIINLCIIAQNSFSKLADILNTRYEYKMISRGDNFPDFNPRNDSIALNIL